jgi:hypothetical protein
MREIKRNCNPRHPIGRKPFFREPHVWLEANASAVEFAVETFDVEFQERTFNLDRKVADSKVE